MSFGKTNQQSPGRTLGWGFSLRLSFYFSVVFTLGALGLLFIGYHSIAGALNDREIGTIEERLDDYRAWLRHSFSLTTEAEIGPNNSPPRLLSQRFDDHVNLSMDELFVRIVGNEFLTDTFLCSPDSQPFIDKEAVKRLPIPGEQTNRYLGGESREFLWTVVSQPFSNTLGGGFLQAGKSQHTTEKVLTQFRRVFFLGVLPALLVGIIGGTLMTYNSIGPIRVLLNTIHDILRTGDLSRRAAPPKGGDELTPLVNAFNRLLRRQERLIASMHSSLDNVAHDLRTPMARLRATAESALQASDEGSIHREALSDCLEESDHVLSMLRTLMELSEAETGTMRLRLEEVSMEDILKTVVELYEFVAEEKQIEFVLESMQNEVVLVADRARLLQLFANLVDNALKYSPPGSSISLGALSTRNHAHVWVQDAGPGIREEEQARIWDRLYRGDRSRSTRGVGLGLSFVRAIAEAHGGSAQVRSDPGHGARFIIRLPLDPPPDAGERVDLTKPV